MSTTGISNLSPLSSYLNSSSSYGSAQSLEDEKSEEGDVEDVFGTARGHLSLPPMDLREQKQFRWTFLVMGLSSCDEVGCFRWTCHHVMRVDVSEPKIPVDLSLRDEGECFATQNSGGPVIT
jgi:hypothetical protein